MMHLGFSLTPFGHDPSAWTDGSRAALNFDAPLRQVIKAEQAGFDFVLLADRMGRRPTDTLSPLATPFEPTTLVSALATRVRKIGFLATAATHQHEPYNLARRFASLDWISHGRSGWNVVAGTDQARDQEYVEVVSALWDSWEDDAFVYDKANSRFFTPEKMHVLNHTGQNFSVRGPLNVNRSPQGKPVLAHVLTDDTTWLAAHQAEVIIAGNAAEAIGAITRQLEQAGRARSDIRIFENVTDFTAAPTDLADSMQQKFEAGKVDGFLLSPPTTTDFDRFCETAVPVLQDRGLSYKEYSGLTLREYLGLHRPAHPAAQLERAS